MTDLFKEPDDHQELDQTKDYLAELVGEDKKFKTVADLARAKAEADRFIEQLKQEQAGIRQELATRVTLEEFMDRMRSGQPDSQTPDSRSNNQEDTGGGDKPLTLADIERLVEERVSGREQKRTEEANLRTVQEELKKAYGDQYVSKLKETAQSLGMSEDYLGNLAKSAPKAFLKLVGVEGQSRQAAAANGLFTPPAGDSRGSGFQPSADKTKSWYDNLRKTDPKTYWLPATQNQMHKDATRLQERFFT